MGIIDMLVDLINRKIITIDRVAPQYKDDVINALPPTIIQPTEIQK